MTRWVTVEPAMFLEMAGDTLTYVIFQNLFIDKICLSMNYNEAFCNALDNSSSELNQNATWLAPITYKIQAEASNFLLYNALVENSLPVILVLFVGVWSDANKKRKPPLLAALTGKLARCLGLLVNAYFLHWSPILLLLTVALPHSLGGGNAVFHMAAFSYIADSTVLRYRTIRMGIAEACWQLGTPVGLYLGAYLYERGGYLCVFATAALFNLIAVLYTAIILPEVPQPRPSYFSRGLSGGNYGSFKRARHYSEGVGYSRGSLDSGKSLLEGKIPPTVPEDGEGYEAQSSSSVWSFLSGSMKTITRPRANHVRKCLIAISIIMLFYQITLYGEVNMKYLFTRNKFQWKELEFSYWTIFDGLMIVLGLTCAMPLFSKIFKFSDAFSGVCASLFRSASKICIALAPNGNYLYLASIIDIVGIIGPLSARSLASKTVLRDERGQVFAFLGFIEATVPLISVPLYSLIYSSTLTWAPEMIYYVSLALSVINMAIFFIMFVAEKAKVIELNGTGMMNLTKTATTTQPQPENDYDYASRRISLF